MSLLIAAFSSSDVKISSCHLTIRNGTGRRYVRNINYLHLLIALQMNIGAQNKDCGFLLLGWTLASKLDFLGHQIPNQLTWSVLTARVHRFPPLLIYHHPIQNEMVWISTATTAVRVFYWFDSLIGSYYSQSNYSYLGEQTPTPELFGFHSRMKDKLLMAPNILEHTKQTKP